ncbi:putative toxin-antitoxin system toxin component, PIN family [Lacihabitans lacunae]|uniref:Toxin-antitoxin system toxin component, PIN family n=1 Tax=Lacihabitans lacunae TaxID=1028214 RepID=A0ABV7YTE1_9BACT
MRVVIDTNCFLAILPKKSIYRPIFDAYRQGKFELVISTDILNEYAKIFSKKMSFEISENIIELILKQPNTIESDIYYYWNLIIEDMDDNKYSDLAISANAEYILTLDRHFDILKTISFPKVKVINLEGFLALIEAFD